MKKRSVNILGHQTSVTLEDEFWRALKTIAESQNKSTNTLIAEIDSNRGKTSNLSSALRVFVLENITQN